MRKSFYKNYKQRDVEDEYKSAKINLVDVIELQENNRITKDNMYLKFMNKSVQLLLLVEQNQLLKQNLEQQKLLQNIKYNLSIDKFEPEREKDRLLKIFGHPYFFDF